MDTGNRNNLIKLTCGFAFAGIFSLCIKGCHQPKTPKVYFNSSSSVIINDNNWSRELREARIYADTAQQLSYREKMSILEAEDRQSKINEMIQVYQAAGAAAYNAAYEGAYYGASDAIQNEADYFFEHLDDYLDDREDELRFNPIIFECNSD